MIPLYDPTKMRRSTDPNHIILMHLHKTPQHTYELSQKFITDHTQDHLGNVVFVELLETGGAVTKRMDLKLERVKETSDIDTPVSDEIVKVNIRVTPSSERKKMPAIKMSNIM
ncbi:hypothetical protein C5167_015979, partial [Papaver somniferum]